MRERTSAIFLNELSVFPCQKFHIVAPEDMANTETSAQSRIKMIKQITTCSFSYDIVDIKIE